MSKNIETPLVVKGDGTQTALTIEGTTPDGPGSTPLAVFGTMEVRVTGPESLAVGQNASADQVGDQSVTAVGNGAMEHATGWRSTAFGLRAAQSNSGLGTTAIGEEAAVANTGLNLVAIGKSAGASNTGANSVAIGNSAAGGSGGDSVVAVGANAAMYVTGTGVVAIGYQAQTESPPLIPKPLPHEHVIAIGSYARALGDFTVQLGNNFKTFTRFGVGNGTVAITASSRRWKEDIEPLGLDEASRVLGAVQAKSFRFTEDAPGDNGGTEQVGFIAEEVRDAGVFVRGDAEDISERNLIAVLWRMVQDQQARIEALEQG